MADQLQLRGGTTAQTATFTGALREVTVDTDKDTLVVHDNALAGGYPLMRENGSNSALALGSAATPSLKFTGDTNTGLFSPGADTIATAANGAEAHRTDSSGRLLVGTSTSSGNNGALQVKQGTSACAYYEISASSGVQNAVDIRNAANAAYKAIRFHVNAYDNIVGSIDVSTTATAYSTSSDYRLKGNVVPLTGAIDRLSQLQVHRFNFIADPDKTVDGFIAHEAQAVVPECVVGTKDEVDADGNPVYQGIDQSKLVPLLTAALQEAIARIETLEADVAALKGA